LTDTAFIPIFGQLADVFGRFAALELAIGCLTIGSILCAAAPIWAILLLGRALQGIGAAGMTNVSMIILADKVSLKEQARNTSLFQLLNGIGYSVGPVIGGYLTNAGWRYVFVLCAAMSGVSCVSIFFLRNDLKAGEVSLTYPNSWSLDFTALVSGLAALDLGGAAFFIAGVALVILGTSWGGSTYPWTHAGVIAPLVIGAVLFVAFLIWEKLLEPGRLLARHMPRVRAMIPFSILKEKDVALVCVLAAATGAAMYSAFYFIGIYFTLVEGYESGKSGLQLLYYVPGLGAGVYTAIFLCNVAPRQTFWPLFIGTIVETAGFAALTYAVKSMNHTLVNAMMVIAGFGTGIRLMPESLHLAGMFRNRLAPAYSMLRFAMPFGGTLALTVMGAVFQNKMASVFARQAINGASAIYNSDSLDAVNDAPPELRTEIRHTGADAVMWAFISIIPVLGLSLLANLFLGNVLISKHENPTSSQDVGAAVTARPLSSADSEAKLVEQEQDLQQRNVQRSVVQRHGLPDILTGFYLLALFNGSIKTKKRPGPAEDTPVDGKHGKEAEAQLAQAFPMDYRRSDAAA
jgi:predicted MFS family arabinose efflux permease